MSKLYVGNLSYSVNDAKLGEIFAPYGNVVSSRVVTDQVSGRSKGFGFVEFENDEAADAAISNLNGKEVDGRSLKVDRAKPPQKREGGFGGGRGRGGFGGGGGGGGGRGRGGFGGGGGGGRY